MMQATTIRQPTGVRHFLALLQRSIELWDRPFSAFILAAIIYTGLSGTATLPWGLSETPYFNLLADAFLHGQLYLRLVPVHPVDLSFFHGQYFLYWGPLPAVLALPWVMAFGASASDVLQTLLFAALAVSAFAALLRAAAARGVIDLTALQRAGLVIFFALGTAFTPLTGTGHVWFQSQVETVLFCFLAYLAAFSLENKRAFFVTGCAIAAVMATRLSAVFVAVYLAWYLIERHWHVGPRRLLVLVITGLAPVVITLGLLAVYNDLRFGSLLDNGYNYHLMTDFYRPDFAQYGIFNLHYIPANLYFGYLWYPISFSPLRVVPKGGSVFLMSPLFFAMFVALWVERKRIGVWMLFLSILLGNIPILLLMGAGGGAFGSRYTLDFVAPMLLLTARGLKYLPARLAALCILIAVLTFLFGSLIFEHFVVL